MPVQIYSGIAPPEALLARMNSQPSFLQGQQSNPGLSASPQSSTPRPPQTHTAPLLQPQQGQFSPPPPTFPGEAPPSYEDAIADGIGPVDGPRRAYDQLPSTPASASSGKASGELGKDERLFPDSDR